MAAPPDDDLGHLDAVRALLAASDYSEAGIAAIGVQPGWGVRAPDVPILLRALEPVEPLATLVRLLLLGQAMDRAVVEARLGADAETLSRAGLVRIDGERVAPTVALTPWRGFILAHDPDPSGDLWAQHVSGPTPAGDTLLAMVTGDGGTALDVGTGCGLLALALSSRVDRVVATDTNPRALRLTTMNARLNGISNIETRSGSLLEPVRDERFHLIVSNPPFVIAPESELIFRHSPFPRDEISREVIRDAAAHLEEGGFGYALVNWVQPPDGAWIDVLRGWLDDTGCDAICLLHGIEDPLAYAVRWNAREQQVQPVRYPETLDRWLAHFRAQSVAAVGTGGVILRRRSGANWVHGLEVRGPSHGDAGPQVRAIVAAQDYVARKPGDETLLGTAFRVALPHRLAQSLATRDGEYVVEPATLDLDEGLGTPLTIEPDLIPVLLRLDGSQRLREIVAEVKGAAHDAEHGALTERTIGLVRELLARGFAVPGAGAA